MARNTRVDPLRETYCKLALDLGYPWESYGNDASCGRASRLSGLRSRRLSSQGRNAGAPSGETGRSAHPFSRSLRGGLPKRPRFRRTEAGRDDFWRYFDAAIDVPRPSVDRLSALAGDLNTYVVIGVIERDGGTLYCTVLFFGSDGAFLGKHRKLMPTAAERLVWGFGDGSTLPVFDTPAGKLGAVIYWENYMPLLRTYMYSQGIAIYCAPTANT